MKQIVKSLSPLHLSLLTLMTPLLSHADLEMRMSKIESQMRDCSTSNARGTYGAKLADASPNIDGYGFYISADAVIYQLQQQNNTYAISSDTASMVPDNFLADGIFPQTLTNHSSTFGWDFGFKVGLGYYAEHDNWQTGFEFTYLETQTSAHTFGDDVHISNNLVPNYVAFLDSGVPFTSASDNWKVYYYNLDWKFGKDFFVSRYLSFLPELGIKSTWFYQTRTNTFSGDNNWNFRSHDNFVGVGPKLDVVTKFWLGKNFSVFGTIDAALLFASNKVKNYFVFDGLDVDYKQHKFNQVTPYLGFNLGFGYDTNFSDDAFNLGIKLSYEQNYYKNASRLYNNDAPSNHDVSMQGVDLSFIFSF
jgi:Legionella pneumophila major outer membrane protein precursor